MNAKSIRKGKKRAKRNYTKRWRRSAMRPTIARQRAELSDEARMSLPYVQNGVLTTGAVASYQIFNGSSLYDPDVSGGGHQPLYRDFWAQAYSNYRVISVKFILTGVCTSGAMQMVLYPQPDSVTTSTVISQDAEKVYAKSTLLNSGGEAKTLSKTMSVPKIFGVPFSTVLNSTDYQANQGTAPSKAFYWILGFQHPDQASAATLSYKVKIIYDVIMFNRVRQNQS